MIIYFVEYEKLAIIFLVFSPYVVALIFPSKSIIPTGWFIAPGSSPMPDAPVGYIGRNPSGKIPIST